MTEIKKTYDTPATKKFLIVINDSEFVSTQELELEKISQTVELKGFRKGHAPMSMIKKLYEEQVKEKAVNAILNTEITKLVKENEFKLAASPTIKEGSEGELSFEVIFDLTPTIPDNFDFSKVTAEMPEIELSEKDLEEELKLIASRNKEFTVKDEASAKGDVAVIDFEGFIDGIPFAGGKGENHELELGSNTFIPGFEDQLIGKRKGDEVDVKVAFPEEYHAKNLAGKEAVFKTIIKEVKAGTMPELNDELAKKFSLETVEDLQKNVKERIEGFYTNAYKDSIKAKIFDDVAKLLTFDIAEGLVEKVVEDLIKNENIEPSQAQEKAIERLRLSFFLTHIGNENKIEVSEQDFTNFIIQSSQDSGMNPFAVLNFYQGNKKEKQKLMMLLEENKIYDFIFSQISKTPKKISRSEFDEMLKKS